MIRLYRTQAPDGDQNWSVTWHATKAEAVAQAAQLDGTRVDVVHVPSGKEALVALLNVATAHSEVVASVFGVERVS